MNSRIAIATTDGVSICEHLARSTDFIVLELEDKRVVSRTIRHRGEEECGNHKSFVEMLEGCAAVICGGIGQGAFDGLRAHGIHAVVAAGANTIDGAAEQYLAGTLATTDDRVCLCH